jgi:DnaK suppressor protein
MLDGLLRSQLSAVRQSVATAREGAQNAALIDALRRLRGSGYGRCADCDAEIPFDRLLAEPQAERCLACSTALEHRTA